MAIVDMSKVYLMGLDKDKENILNAFQDTGQFEIVDMEGISEQKEESWYENVQLASDTESIEQLERELAEIEFAMHFLNQRADSPAPKGVTATSCQLADMLARKDEILQIVDLCRSLDAEENELDSERHRLRNDVTKMLPWLGMNLRLEELVDTKHVKLRPGSVPKQLAADFTKEINALELAFVKELGAEKEEDYFFIAYHQTVSKQIGELIQKYDFSRANFGKAEGTPSEIIDELDEKIKATYVKKDALQLKAQELAVKRVDLMRLYDALGLSLQRRKASNRCVDTQKTFHLQGWVKSSEQKQLEETLQSVTQVYQLTFTEPGADEPFPVYTKNVKAVTPFEMVTNLYSVPASDGIDPNNVVAPFHAMFLGLMMADVGYGIILSLAGHFYAKVAKGGAKKIAGVIKYAGLFAIMWGVLLGSYFGDIGSRLGLKALLLDPMEDPVLMLALSLGLGAVHIFVGLGVKAYMLIKDKKYLDALFDVGLWYLVLVGLPLLATPFASVGQWLAIGGLVGLVLTQGRTKKNFFGKLLGGVGSLYDITGYLSDILSYSRLFALLLSTAVVAMVFNQIAFMVGTSWIGFLFAAIVFIIGHAFNLFIGGLGAFVHGSRLIYVEFFSKFFIGGGHAFDPLHKETKYVSLEEKEAM